MYSCSESKDFKANEGKTELRMAVLHGKLTGVFGHGCMRGEVLPSSTLSTEGSQHTGREEGSRKGLMSR